jgi:hypothetical protein
MIVYENDKPVDVINETATACHPKANGGQYPMWIQVKYTDNERTPPHAHLYSPDQRPSKSSLITKFLITPSAPRKKEDVKVMKGMPPVLPAYAQMIIDWARGKTKSGTNNWTALCTAWEQLEMTFL